MTDQLGPNHAGSPEQRRNSTEPDQWTPVQAGEEKRTKAHDDTEQPAPNGVGQPQQQQQSEPAQPQQQPQPMYWNQFAAQQMNMDPDFVKLRTARSQITAANIMGPVSLIIGGMPLSIAGIVCAVLAYRNARKVGEGTSPSAPFAQNFARSARVSIVICCVTFVLNAVSFVMMLPLLMEILNGDMSAIMDLSGLDGASVSSGSTDSGSAWG